MWRNLSLQKSVVLGFSEVCVNQTQGCESRSLLPSSQNLQWASQVALWVENPAAHVEDRRRRFNPWVGKIPWRRAWQPTPVFSPGESCGQSSLVGYSPCGCRESDMTEAIEQAHTHSIPSSRHRPSLQRYVPIPQPKMSDCDDDSSVRLIP